MRKNPSIFSKSDGQLLSMMLSINLFKCQLRQLPAVFPFQHIAHRHFADDVFHGDIQRRSLAVVGRIDKIYPSFFQKLFHLAVTLLIDSDGIAALCFHHFHTGHITESVADVNHVGKGHTLVILRHGTV